MQNNTVHEYISANSNKNNKLLAGTKPDPGFKRKPGDHEAAGYVTSSK